MTKLLRYLRITFSAACGITCLLLIVLWVRSYWSVDRVYCRTSGVHEISTWHARGEIILWTNDLRVQDSQYPDGSLRLNSWPIDEYPVRPIKFDYSVLDYGTSYGVPYWFPVLMVVVFAGIPWFTLPKTFNRLAIMSVILIALIIVFLAIGLIAKIEHDLNIAWPPVPENDNPA